MTLRSNDYDKNGDIIPDSVREEKEVRLIDAEDLKAKAQRYRNKACTSGTGEFWTGVLWGVDEIVEYIDNAPTVITDDYTMGYQDGVRKVLSERPHGKWERIKNGTSTYKYKCDRCEHIGYSKSNFCSNCGADMRGNAV